MELRLVDPDGYTANIPGHTTVIRITRDFAPLAAAHMKRLAAADAAEWGQQAGHYRVQTTAA